MPIDWIYEDPLKGQHPCYERPRDGDTSLPHRLGGGSFGQVFRYIHHTQDGHEESVAIKVLSTRNMTSPAHWEYCRRECLNHRRLSLRSRAASQGHRHVIQFKEAFLIHDHLCICMEYADLGSLRGFLRRFPDERVPEQDARWLFIQLMVGIEFCHDRGITNRDIKLENTLLQVLTNPESVVGTDLYLPPESFSGRPYDGKASDMYACGIMLYAMVCGHTPFDLARQSYLPGEEQALVEQHGAAARQLTVRERIYWRIRRGQWRLPDCLKAGVTVSRELVSLIGQMLATDPAQRPSAAQALKHPWITMFGPLQMLTQYNADYFAAEQEEDDTCIQSERMLLNILDEAEARASAASVPTSRYAAPPAVAAATGARARGGDGSSSSWGSSSGNRSYRTRDSDDSRCLHSGLGH